MCCRQTVVKEHDREAHRNINCASGYTALRGGIVPSLDGEGIGKGECISYHVMRLSIRTTKVVWLPDHAVPNIPEYDISDEVVLPDRLTFSNRPDTQDVVTIPRRPSNLRPQVVSTVEQESI